MRASRVRKPKSEQLFTVGRVVTAAESLVLDTEPTYVRLRSARRCLKAAAAGLKQSVSLLQTSGGFLKSYPDLSDLMTGERTRRRDFQRVKELGSELLHQFLDAKLLSVLREKARFLTIGVDLGDFSEGPHAELVASVDLEARHVIGWTGKSHPLASQARTLVYCVDLASHFQMFGDRRVLVLGCHDMNIFSNRARASARADTYKGREIAKMQRLADQFRPEIVLSHPHFTDSPRIWSTALSGIEESIKTARIISIGVHYENPNGDPRGLLEDVLDATSRGHVIDLVVHEK